MRTLKIFLGLAIAFMITSCSIFKGNEITEPTVKADKSKRVVRDLLDNNSGCQLPCWWGITPGKTTWDEARQILDEVSLFIGGQQSSDDFYASVKAYLPYPDDFAPYMEQLYGVEDGVVNYIRVYNFDLAPNYSLPSLLQSYGQPSEVGFEVISKEEREIQPFIVDVFYRELGILVEYSTVDPMKEVGENLQNCLISKMDSPFLHLWSVETQYLSFQEAKKFIDTTNLPEPKSLLEATGMDAKSFYETFKNSETDACLETPKNLWQ